MEMQDILGVNKAEIELNKINVVGGVNASGKSTVSKTLYSFLKANSNKRRECAMQFIAEDINRIIDELNYPGNEYDIPRHLEKSNSPAHIKRVYDEISKIYERHREMAEIKLDELEESLNDFIKKLQDDGFDANEIIESNPFKISEDKVPESLKRFNDIYSKYVPLNFFITRLESYISLGQSNVFPFLSTEEMWEYKQFEEKFEEYEDKFLMLKSLDVQFLTYGDYLSERIDRFFGIDDSYFSKETYWEVFVREFGSGIPYCPPPTKFHVKIDDSQCGAFDYYFNNGFIGNVYYVDNASVSDLIEKSRFGEDNKRSKPFHTNELVEELSKPFVFEDMEPVFDLDNPEESASRKVLKLNLSSDVETILSKIHDVIKGKFRGDIFYDDGKDKWINTILAHELNVASGIKQIGMIQILLMNAKLKKDDFLIIDEPEVNLHPEWQFKFAEILVLLAKDLNITIYLNSHSPFFIEAIDAFTEFYDMQDDVNYYLTQESENEGKYDFTRIRQDELYKIYDNLGRPYDLIDQLRLRKHLGD